MMPGSHIVLLILNDLNVELTFDWDDVHAAPIVL
jgi:hypothetical protein